MKRTDKEIEKMLLDDLEETITMGWADTSEKVLLLELIRERQVKNNFVLADVIKSVCGEKCKSLWTACEDCLRGYDEWRKKN